MLFIINKHSQLLLLSNTPKLISTITRSSNPHSTHPYTLQATILIVLSFFFELYFISRLFFSRPIPIFKLSNHSKNKLTKIKEI